MSTMLLEKTTGKEHMVVDDSTMWGSTVREQMANAGVQVAIITAKDKLRRIINYGITPARGAVCFLAQHADE
ncbi:hypothetical protein LTR86_009305 [Recurvomyces mirabilis]|nr:hypothetical protein LTR86_009305 [Recurvomyces mirabilis]